MYTHTCGVLHTLQHTATHCNTLQHTATHCSTLHVCVCIRLSPADAYTYTQCAAVCCNVLLCVAVLLLQMDSRCRRMYTHTRSVLQCAAMCCCVLLCCFCRWTLGVSGCIHIHAVCCSVLQCVAVCCCVASANGL